MESREDSSGRPSPVRILLQPRVQSRDQKRAAERTSTLRTVSARLEEQSGWTDVPLLNVSATGLQLCVGEAVETGATLWVRVLPNRELEATVRWSRADDGDWIVGAEWRRPLAIDDVWKARVGD